MRWPFISCRKPSPAKRAHRHELVGAAGLAHLVDRSLRVVHTVDLAGFPIRARLSPDERYAVATVFVTGESYESDFTTRTTIIDVRTGATLGDLEQYETRRGQPRTRAARPPTPNDQARPQRTLKIRRSTRHRAGVDPFRPKTYALARLTAMATTRPT